MSKPNGAPSSRACIRPLAKASADIRAKQVKTDERKQTITQPASRRADRNQGDADAPLKPRANPPPNQFEDQPERTDRQGCSQHSRCQRLAGSRPTDGRLRRTDSDGYENEQCGAEAELHSAILAAPPSAWPHVRAGPAPQAATGHTQANHSGVGQPVQRADTRGGDPAASATLSGVAAVAASRRTRHVSERQGASRRFGEGRDRAMCEGQSCA